VGEVNPIVKVVDHAAARVPGGFRPPLDNELRTRRDRVLLEVMWEGGLRPGEVLGLRLEDLSYGQRRIAVCKRNDHPQGVRQKSRRDRVVDLLEGRDLPALNDYVMRERPTDADSPWVFLVGGKGKRRRDGAAPT
jgi:integrase